MKIRTGFVSNSSSSSFAIIISVEEHDRIVDTMRGWEQKAIKAMIDASVIKKNKIFGRDVYTTLMYGESNWGSPRPDGIREIKGLEAKTRRVANNDPHYPDCKLKGQKVETDFCPHCGSTTYHEEKYQVPEKAWDDYFQKIKNRPVHPAEKKQIVFLEAHT